MQKFILLILFFLSAVSFATEKKFDKPQKVIIIGKVKSFDNQNKQIKLVVNKLCFRSEEISINIDSLGNFSTSFYSSIPNDIYLYYGQRFAVLTHPGDSIFIEFDGQDLLETVKFSGSAAKTNQDVLEFQKLFNSYYHNSIESKENTLKEFDTEKFLIYLENEKTEWNKLYNEYLEKNTPNEEVKTWILTELKSKYFYDYSFYPLMHKHINNLEENEWNVPENYYDNLINIAPINKPELINVEAINGLVNQYLHFYAMNKATIDNKIAIKKDSVMNQDKWDSLFISGIIKYTPDSFLRQMVLTEFFTSQLGASVVNLFEKYRFLIDEHIQESYLKEPLFEMYEKVKKNLLNPEIASNAILQKIDSSSSKQVFNSILEQNKGKIIYLDFWATWCGPCLGEMPESKKLMDELKDKNVSFIYLCIDSEESVWKATLSKFQLEGYQYYFNKEQSEEIRGMFEIHGIPFYVLIDDKGNIIEKGSHLRPDYAREKIGKLL